MNAASVTCGTMILSVTHASDAIFVLDEQCKGSLLRRSTGALTGKCLEQVSAARARKASFAASFAQHNALRKLWLCNRAELLGQTP